MRFPSFPYMCRTLYAYCFWNWSRPMIFVNMVCTQENRAQQHRREATRTGRKLGLVIIYHAYTTGLDREEHP